MSRAELIRMFEDNEVNMQTIFADRNDLTKDDLAILAMEIYYELWTRLSADDREQSEWAIANELKDAWEN